jgi:hypothetical protein
MPDLTDIKDNWQQYDIRLIAVAISLVISIIIILIPDTPNNDAFTYIRAAEIFQQQGLTAAFQHYSWASYSILIALLSNLGFNLFTSALLINSVFYALLVHSFLSIVKEIDESKVLLLLAAVSILFYPQLNEFRSFIIRDTGFWALTIFSLYQLLLYSRLQTPIYGFMFCAALLFAATFRVEAIAFLVTVPFALLLDKRSERTPVKVFLSLYGIIVLAMVLALIAVSIAGFSIVQLFTNYVSVYLPIITVTVSPDPQLAADISALLFSEHAALFSQEYLPIFIAAGLVAILLANLFNGIGGPYLIILICGIVKRNSVEKLQKQICLPLLAYMLVNLLVILSFLFLTRYMTSRYTMVFSILLSLYVPLIFYGLLNSATVQKKRLIVFIGLFFSYCAIDSYVSFGEKKAFVEDSIEWIEQNANPGTGLHTNNNSIAYYSGLVENYDELTTHITQSRIESANVGDLIVVELNHSSRQLFNSAGAASYLNHLQDFPSMDKGEPRISIYRRVQPVP